MSALTGGVFAANPDDDLTELRTLVDDIGTRSAAQRVGRRGLPEEFDDDAWSNLEDTGLSRLTCDAEGAGPRESAVVLRGLARHCVAAPIAETDLLAGWLAETTGLEVPGTGPLTLAQADSPDSAATQVPWARSASAIVLVVRDGDHLLATTVAPSDVAITDGHNLGGEPRDTVAFDMSAFEFRPLNVGVVDELHRRGAWARCIQCIGVLDAAAELAVAHTRDRVQFGRPLSQFQAVQHGLASMAGEIERARAATELAVAAASDHGFGASQTDYAVSVAKVTLGRVIPTVSTVAHQLHGAIGVTLEHPLWSATNRAHSWIEEFGSTGWHARRLGRVVLSANDGQLWDVMTSGRVH